MRVPTTEFLDDIERRYSVKYPEQYREFCALLKDSGLQSTVYGSSNVDFISDLETFWSVNVRVGEQQWGDYERAIAGKEHPKDKNRLWGGILPFFDNDDDGDVFGFSADGSSVRVCTYDDNGNALGFSFDGDSGDRVYVWSVHTIVHVYPSLSAFVEDYLRV